MAGKSGVLSDALPSLSLRNLALCSTCALTSYTVCGVRVKRLS